MAVLENKQTLIESRFSDYLLLISYIFLFELVSNDDNVINYYYTYKKN